MTCDDNSFDSETRIDVYSDCSSTEMIGTTCVVFNDDYCGKNAAVIIPPSESGYYIFVSSRTSTFDGVQFTLTVKDYTNETNDRCWQATRIVLPSEFSGNTMDHEVTSHPTCAARSRPRRTAWFSYINRGHEEIVLVFLRAIRRT